MFPALAALVPALAGGASALGAGTAAAGGTALGGGLMGMGAMEGAGGLAMGEGMGGLFSMADKISGVGAGGDLSMAGGYNPMDAVGGDMAGRISDMAADPNVPGIPKPPGKAGPDVSGFANYGMTAPDLWQMPGLESQLGGLMGMATQQYNRPREFQQMPQGGLMDYMASLR